MNHDNPFLDNLTRSSMRLNKGLLILLGLTLLLVGISYWSGRRLLEEQHDTFRFHFARLMENIHEHESFLKKSSEQSRTGELTAEETSSYQKRSLPDEGPNTYESREYSFSIPFSLSINAARINQRELPKVFSLGAHLTHYYSAFWAISHYQSPQTFLFNTNDNFYISVPGAGHTQGSLWRETVPNKVLAQQVLKRVLAKSNQPADGVVTWETFKLPNETDSTLRLLAYVNIHLRPEQMNIQEAGNRVVVASLLSMEQVNNIERIMAWTLYDQFTLIAPSGEVLYGTSKPDATLHEGLNVNLDGLVFKESSSSGPPWTAIYTISFKSYFDYTLWPLLSLLALLVSASICGWAISRWYKRRIVIPAYQAHQQVTESEAFGRVVIDTAPTGLCVIRRSDFKILLQNQRAQQWTGTPKLLEALLEQQQNLQLPGEAQLDIDGVHQQVGFVSTRYQSEDAILCAFNDVTSHIEDAVELEQARRSADAANEAKTLFLATMSHEIRTPLYGVLGTLELLGLTRLDLQQQEYLLTIQRSSTTLFQLISDVLDISKIESGQMDIEISEFCPLSMIEDTLHTYAAFAERKGLLLYSCIDATLPDLVLGDPIRIRQILNNLVSNAIKFTDTGRVVVRAKVVGSRDDRISIEWQVSDTGIGISPSQQAQLFETFYQVRDASSEAGAGLGLAICRWLSEMMQGRLRVVSEPGLGSSFSLNLELKSLPGPLPDCTDIAPTTHPVYVRAPAQELAQSICDWLNRLGVPARLVPGYLEQSQQETLLVDILPTRTSSPWPGPQVRCLYGERHLQHLSAGNWEADVHDIRAIARTVSLATQGKSVNTPSFDDAHRGQLNLRILVAEDNPINQAIIKEQLEALGCEVTVASNGEQALQLWQPTAFDLVLTDVNMPLLNGYELAKALRERDRQIPIVGVTANAMREEGLRCTAVGMNAWMVKPLSLQALYEHLSKLSLKPANTSERSVTAPSTGVDRILLPVVMHELFISTMRQDIQSITDALLHNDARTLADSLHRVAGALGAVQASALATTCAELECRLLQHSITPDITLEVQQVVKRMSDILETLE